MDIVFVILHYLTSEDTSNCIDSIRKKIDTESYHIVVVDNASGNGSFEILQTAYGDASDVTLMSNEENLGFARGLNVGINYAREHFAPDFIALINNDTQLVSFDMVGTMKMKHKQYGFAVLGPMIITADGLCSVNPILESPRNAQDVCAAIHRHRKINTLCRFHLYGLYMFLKNLMPEKKKTTKTLHLDDLTDCKLHGSFWILSKDYFTFFDGLNPDTFLYGEEDILYLSVLKAGLHTLYTPDICIYHKENSSTDSALPNSSKKAQFVCKYCIESLDIYLNLLKDKGQSEKVTERK